MARSKHPWRKLERNVMIYIKHEYFAHTLEELAEEYEITPNRISQIIRNVYYREKHGDEEYIKVIDSFLPSA